MFKFGGEKILPIDEKFEIQKVNQERENYNIIRQELAKEFSEKLERNPIEMYYIPTSWGLSHETEKVAPIKSFKEVKEVDYGLGAGRGGNLGPCSITFDRGEWIEVDGKHGVFANGYLNGIFKISKQSMDNILDMMDKIISRSGCSDNEKNEMYQDVLIYLKNKVIKEDLEKTEN